jgi:hypothetical protein
LPTPILTFSFIIATLFGAVFHLIAGGDIRRLALFLLAGWLGFAIGHLVGVVSEINVLNVGVLRLLPALLGALFAVLAAYFLTLNRRRKRVVR